MSYDTSQEDQDLDSLYGGLDVGTYERPKSFVDRIKKLGERFYRGTREIQQQSIKGGLIGLGGAYGDVLDLVGGQAKDTLPGEQQRRYEESDTLDKIMQPGYQPSFADIENLTELEELPRYSRTANSREAEEFSDLVGGPGEPTTVEGKVANRISRIYGGGLAFGQKNPAPAVTAGTFGQAAEELGFSPGWQLAVEIASLVGSGGKGSALNQSKGAIKDKVDQMRKLGYNDKEITLAINAAKDQKSLIKKLASKGKKSEEAIGNFGNKTEQLINDTLVESFPGLEKGTKSLHERASKFYGDVAQEGTKIPITNSSKFIKSADEVLGELRNTLGANEQAAPFMKRLEAAIADTAKNPTADRYVNFYKELNTMGDWVGRSQKDRILSKVKNGIKETLNDAGPEGQKFALKFSMANKGVERAYQAEEVSQLLGKAHTGETYDWNKLKKTLDKPENIELLEGSLGKRQTENLYQMSKLGKDVKDFDKSWGKIQGQLSKKDIAKGLIKGASYGTPIGSGILDALEGNWEKAALKIGSAAAFGGLKISASRLAEKSLTDPKFQNIIIRGLNALKTESPRVMLRVQEDFQKYVEENGLDIPD